MPLLDDPDICSLEEQETFINLSKEAKLYKILFDKCIDQFEQDIDCTMDIAKKGIFGKTETNSNTDGMIKGFISIIDDSFIGALLVDNTYQGQGIGKQLDKIE